MHAILHAMSNAMERPWKICTWYPISLPNLCPSLLQSYTGFFREVLPRLREVVTGLAPSSRNLHSAECQPDTWHLKLNSHCVRVAFGTLCLLPHWLYPAAAASYERSCGSSFVIPPSLLTVLHPEQGMYAYNTGGKFFLDQRFSVHFEICIPEGRGGEKGGNANLKTMCTEPSTQEVPWALYLKNTLKLWIEEITFMPSAHSESKVGDSCTDGIMKDSINFFQQFAVQKITSFL